MIEELKRKIAEFEQYQALIERQQLSYPLDKTSADLAHKDIPVPTGRIVEPYNISNYNDAPEVRINGAKYLLSASDPY